MYLQKHSRLKDDQTFVFQLRHEKPERLIEVPMAQFRVILQHKTSVFPTSVTWMTPDASIPTSTVYAYFPGSSSVSLQSPLTTYWSVLYTTFYPQRNVGHSFVLWYCVCSKISNIPCCHILPCRLHWISCRLHLWLIFIFRKDSKQ